MSFERFRARCERADPNDGTVSLTFSKRADFTDEHAREELVQASIKKARGPYEVGKDYWIEIYPA